MRFRKENSSNRGQFVFCTMTVQHVPEVEHGLQFELPPSTMWLIDNGFIPDINTIRSRTKMLDTQFVSHEC